MGCVNDFLFKMRNRYSGDKDRKALPCLQVTSQTAEGSDCDNQDEDKVDGGETMSHSQNAAGERGDRHRLGTTRMLTRIITLLSQSRLPRNKEWIVRNVMCKEANVIDALHFMVCNRLVFKHKTPRDRGMWVYSINPAFVEMRGVKG